MAPAEAPRKTISPRRTIPCSMVAESWRQTGKEVRRSKCTFCLGCTSCLVVVVAAVVMQSLLGQTPLIYLRNAERRNGEIDMEIIPGLWTKHAFVNYTMLANVLDTAPDRGDEFSFHAPRITLLGESVAPSQCITSNMTGPTVYGSTSDDHLADNKWMYEKRNGQSGSYCLGSCLYERCSGSAFPSTFQLIDTAKEARMQLGRSWPYGRMPAGQGVVTRTLARALNVVEGDTIYVQFSIPDLLRFAFGPSGPAQGATSGLIPEPNSDHPGDDNYAWGERTVYHGQVAVPVQVMGVLASSEGKAADKFTGMFLEYDTFGEWITTRLHPLIRHTPGDAKSARAKPDLYDSATMMVVNMPPEERLDSYLSSNYDTIQASVARFASTVVYLTDFPQMDTELPVLESIFRARFTTLYMGLFMNILLFILGALSTLLIYSLLQINVSSRMFELAIRRMIGATRGVVVLLLATQALAYSIPALAIGLFISSFLAKELVGQFGSLSGVPVDAGMTFEAVLLGIFLALFIPMLAAIGPIRGALARTLRDALDVHRPKSDAVEYHIERAEDAGVPWSLVAIGSTLTVFGFAIYYLIPLSLLSFDLALFFNVFFGILLAMLFGLVLLALNLEMLLEKGVIYTTLFWEKNVMKRLSVSNLVAHRRRNRKTMIMYALSIAFIVFISSVTNLQLQSTVFVAEQEAGCDLYLEADHPGSTRRRGTPSSLIRELEDLVAGEEFVDSVIGTTWISQMLPDQLATYGQTQQDSEHELTNLGHLYSRDVEVFGVSPSFYDHSFEDFWTAGNVSQANGLSISQQLYTIRGSQGLVVSTSVKDDITVGLEQSLLYSQEVETDVGTQQAGTLGQPETEVRTNLARMETSAMMTAGAVLEFSEFPGRGDGAMVSLPTLVRMSRGAVSSISDLAMLRFMILLDPEADADVFDELVERLEQIGDPHGWSVGGATLDTEGSDETRLVISFVTTTMSIVALFLCFFSLIASMITNIREQTREAGVLRALGLTGGRLIRLFVYEAYALVLASSLMGVGVGVVLGWTFGQQMALFTEINPGFFVPWDIVVIVSVASILCSWLAAALPGKYLTTLQVTELLRTVT